MKKKILVSFFIGILCLQLNGCSLYPDGTLNGLENGQTVNVQENSHIKSTINDNLEIDADVIKKDNIDFKKYIVSDKTYDRSIADSNAEIMKFSNSIVDANERGESCFFTYGDGSEFADIVNGFVYSTYDSRKFRYQLYVHEDGSRTTYDRKMAFPLDELSDFSKVEAVNQVKELCHKLNIPLSDNEPNTYVMDSESMNSYLQNIAPKLKEYDSKSLREDVPEGEIEWTKDDEVYYMIFDLNLDDMPYNSDAFESGSKYSYGTSLTIAIGKNGIKSLKVSKLYTKATEELLNADIIDVSEVADIIASKFQYITNGNFKYKFTEIKLVYAPMGIVNKNDNSYEATPFWECSYEQVGTDEKSGSEYKIKKKMYIDAVTKTTY